MVSIFISYRRDDSAGWTGRLSDDLKERFGQEAVFQDIEDIGPGDDFYVAIEHSLESCSVVLVVIGREWVHINDETGARRLDNPKDPVRFEVAKALARQDRLVIPVLVGGAKMPTADELPEELKALAHRNAFKLSDEDWKPNLEKLTARLVKKTDLTHKSDAASPTALPEPKLDEPKFPWRRYLKYLPLMAMLLVLVAGVIQTSKNSKQNTTVTISSTQDWCGEQVVDVLVNNNSNTNELFASVQLEPDWVWARSMAGEVPPEGSYEVHLDEWVEFIRKTKDDEDFLRKIESEGRVVEVNPPFVPFGYPEDKTYNSAYKPDPIVVSQIVKNKFVSIKGKPERFTIKLTLSDEMIGWVLDGSFRLKIITDHNDVITSNLLRFSLCKA